MFEIFWVEKSGVEKFLMAFGLKCSGLKCPPVTPFLYAGKSHAQNGQNNLTLWVPTLTQTYLIFVDNLDL